MNRTGDTVFETGYVAAMLRGGFSARMVYT
jgi:hypothetical protein